LSKVASLPQNPSANLAGTNPEQARLQAIVMATPATMVLDGEPEPFPADWVLSGAPMARSKILSRSRDWTSSVVVWECTAGSFRWYYSQDETVFFLTGEAFLLQASGGERRFGPGDLAFFPSGTTCTWRVADSVRKVAVLRESMGSPLGLCLKAWKKLLRVVGLSPQSPL
jgi:uncharacterized cupin superfamily protein